MARFFVDGIEVDVDNPTFHLPSEKIIDTFNAVADYLEEHVNN